MALSERLRAELLLLSEESQAEVRRLAGEEPIDWDERRRRYAEWRAGVERLHGELSAKGVWVDAVAEIRALRDGTDEDEP